MGSYVGIPDACQRDWEKGVLTISQQTFAEHFADEYRAVCGKSVPFPVGKRLEFEENEAPGYWPFRDLANSLMWLSNPDPTRYLQRSESSGWVLCRTHACALEGNTWYLGICETDEFIRNYF